MNKRIPVILLFAIAISGCASVQEKPTLNAKNESQSDATQARGQLLQFAKIIEHITQATTTEDTAGSQGTEKINQVINRLDGPLQTLESTGDDTEKVRQMLAAADDISGNRQQLFSGLFDLFSDLIFP